MYTTGQILQGPIVDAVLAAGRANSRYLSSKSPLMYSWKSTRYWGAAHGLAGILQILMHFPLKQQDIDDVKGTLRYMIKGRYLRGNYRASEGNNRGDRLVHWCHGAPGVVMTLCRAVQVIISRDLQYTTVGKKQGRNPMFFTCMSNHEHFISSIIP